MTLDEAIKILKLHQEPTEWDLYNDDVDAIRLGSEALEQTQYIREHYTFFYAPTLPSETKD